MVIRARIDAEMVAHCPDVFGMAKQADAVSAVLTLQAMLFKELTKLTHVFHIYVAVRTYAPLSGHVVDGKLRRHQPEGFGAFFDRCRLG